MKLYIFLIAIFLLGFTLSNTINCSICKSVINISENELGKNTTSAKATDYLKNEVCFKLPNLFMIQCEVFVSANLNALVTAIVDNQNSTTACDAMNACTDKK
eukprot:TRINITY_DN17410_c0_g1_i1.p1 TRINITY_DN17410_c0_g1~~TRINITY_DN17410_c0_g1_i1.p1  ORF type:complete len:102 (+),score=19.98 TRINITY_DN17410_c0_g1_i1:21-326(+)